MMIEMNKDSDDELPNNPIEAQGLLIKAVYKKFGDQALSVIEEVLGKQGKALGLKLRNKIPDTRLSTVAKAFSKSFSQDLIKVVSISDTKFHITGNRCPFGLENTSRSLCEAVMAIDREYFCAATGKKVKLQILKTVAAGDLICDTIYLIENENK